MLFNKIDLPISDGRDVALKGAARSAEYIVQKDSGDKRIVTVIASDESVDRDGDIIRQSGWKGLKTWEKSGAVLWSHNYSLQAVGVPHKAWVDKDKKRLMAELSFPEEYGRAHPPSEAVYQGMKVRAIPAVSVGFQPVEDTSPSDEDRAELGMGPFGLIFTKQELFEISPCNVASNRNALVQQVKAAGINTEALEELLQHEDNFVIEVSSNGDTCDGTALKIGKDVDDVGCKCEGKGYDDSFKYCSCERGVLLLDIYTNPESYFKVADTSTAKSLLEEAGYEVTEKQDTETLTVVIEEPMTVELDLSPEPETLSEETLDKLARQIADATPLQEEIDKIGERTKRAVKRVIDYHSGKVVEDE